MDEAVLTSLLQQIVDELGSVKNEITDAVQNYRQSENYWAKTPRIDRL
jgi:hypothetical protein